MVVIDLKGLDKEKLLKAIAIEKAKLNYRAYITYVRPGYHWSAAHDYLAKKIQAFVEAVERKESPRLMLFLPPRFGKSEITSRLLPGWVLGRNPDATFGLVSYGAELAEELSADARRVVLDDPFAEVFGVQYTPDPSSSVEIDRASKAVNHWRIAGRRGGVRAVGVGGALTGRGFNICAIDDPIKGREDADSELERERLWKWYHGTLRTRMEPGAGLLLIQTRWHHDDLAGRLQEAARENPKLDQWEIVVLPALAGEDDPVGRAPGEALDPERFDVADFESLRASDSREWFAQYQQQPTPDEGEIFKREWFHWEWPCPKVSQRAPCFQYIDTAHGKTNPKLKGDRTVIGTWRYEGNKYRLIHLYVGRPNYPTLKSIVLEGFLTFRPKAIIVEDAQSGQSLIQDLRNQTALPILPWKTHNESKKERARAITPTMAAGKVVISIPKEQAEIYIREHLQFPQGKYDDIVDMTSMAVAHLSIWMSPARTGRARLTTFRFVAA